MANAIDVRSVSATYTTTDRDEKSAKRRSSRLSSDDAEDLRYFLSGVSSDLGFRSVHAAVERRLLMAPPREDGRPILDELGRRNDWIGEGKLLRIVVAEGWGTISEMRRALRRLIRDDHVERRPCQPPEVAAAIGERTAAEQLQLQDYIGFEIRAANRKAQRLEAIEPAERWRRQDEEIEREWLMVHGSETRHTGYSYEPPENVQWGRINRVRRALTRLSERQANVLAAVFGQRHITETEELGAVRALVGGDDEKARDAIDAACTAYREARAS